MLRDRIRNDLVRPTAVFVALSLIAWLCYLPGLSGSFLFDDFVNLPALGAYGPVDNSETFWRYITSGVADPTGRPISLLTFLLDGNNWPTDPYPFKRTNVLLHLLNGGLLFVLLWHWGRLLKDRHQAGIAAAFGAGLWMLHPLMVSTTLYVVQREAMLPATFILLGLLGYSLGYLQAAQGKRPGIWVAAASVVLFTVLAVLSKANGALLPAFAWLADRLLLSKHRPLPEQFVRPMQRMRFTVLVLPTLLLGAYLAHALWSGFVHGTPPHRPWTMAERLMTESRIVFDYLALLWAPRPYSGGLFNDAYAISRGLFDPPTTVLGILAFLGMVIGATIWHKRLGVWAFAFLFFVVGHVMETGVLPLELYYEHRNYLPAMLMFWPLGLLLVPGAQTRSRHGPLGGFRIVLLIVLPLTLAGMTWMGTSLWGDPLAQARLWAKQSPESPRALAYVTQIEIDQGDSATVIQRLQTLLAQKPDEVQLALNLVEAKCQQGGLDEASLLAAERALRTSAALHQIGYDWFEKAIPVAVSGSCTGLGMEQINGLIAAAKSNSQVKELAGVQHDLDSSAAKLELSRQQPDLALEYFNRAYDAQPRTSVALAQAAWLASAGYYGQALAHLDHAKKSSRPVEPGKIRSMSDLHKWLLERQGYWTGEMAILECTIAQDAGPSELHRCNGGHVE